ncbi:MAG: fold metallo-hydrolase [Nocardia sp.]|uniref:MBL fold metallo-hydrolase n=1 Tax=Nocardia sp. TaxID=1821 RepID=UPI00260222D1|nr:MBL fold metallo-hydrolase [Nocardia sp.]MCU1644977.1 fold metallo-hydrolase [Nocardia sp.]
MNSEVDQDGRLRRASGIRSIRLGDTRVSYVPDGALQLPPCGWLPASTDEFWAARPEYLDSAGYLVAGIGALLVERGDRTLLIDAGFGPRSLPPDPNTPRGTIYGGELLDSPASLGRRPEQIEAVAFTHLHPDHVGWAWHPIPGGDELAFAGADYLVAEPEWVQRDLFSAQGISDEILTAFEPRVRTVKNGQEIFPGVRVRIRSGHTVGHAEYVITGGGRRLIAFGDALHSPIQVEHPEWSAAVDYDSDQAAEHRRRLVAELAEPDMLGFGIHFADVVFGRVRRHDAGSTWWPLSPAELYG